MWFGYARGILNSLNGLILVILLSNLNKISSFVYDYPVHLVYYSLLFGFAGLDFRAVS